MRQVSRHDGCATTIESEWGFHHAAITYGHKMGNASLGTGNQRVNGVTSIPGRLPIRMRLARTMGSKGPRNLQPFLNRLSMCLLRQSRFNCAGYLLPGSRPAAGAGTSNLQVGGRRHEIRLRQASVDGRPSYLQTRRWIRAGLKAVPHRSAWGVTGSWRIVNSKLLPCFVERRNMKPENPAQFQDRRRRFLHAVP